MEKKPVHLGEVISSILKRHEKNYLYDGIDEIKSAWQNILGNYLSDVASPCNIKKGILTVTVSDAICLQELIFRKNEILEEISSLCNGIKIKDIRFVPI